VDLTTFLGDGVIGMESTLPDCPLEGSILALSMLYLWGLCFLLGLLSLSWMYDDTLMVVSYGCITTLTVYTCLLLGVVCSWMMLCHMRHGVNLLFLTLQWRRTFKFLPSPRTEEFKFPTSSALSSIRGIDLWFFTSLDALSSVDPCMGGLSLLSHA